MFSGIEHYHIQTRSKAASPHPQAPMHRSTKKDSMGGRLTSSKEEEIFYYSYTRIIAPPPILVYE